MSKRDFATILRERGFSVWAERVESGTAEPIDAMMSIAQYGGNKSLVLDLCRVIGGHGPADFFMVYREGGRSPTFKHSTEEAAFVEANRIARESGEKTYVLSAVKAIDPYQMPTVEQFAKHAEMHGSGNGVGLWRVSGGPRAFPEIVPIRVDRGTAWYASVVNGVSVSRVGDCDGAKWFPLDANGKDLVEDDCPF